MKKYSEDLVSTKSNNLKYIFILIYFIVVYSAFIHYNIDVLYHVAFIVGIIGFTLALEKVEKELRAVRMKNHFIKSKLSYKIDELESAMIKKHGAENKKIIEGLLKEIEH